MMLKQKKKSKKKIVIWSVIGFVIATLILTAVFTPKGTNAYEKEKAKTGSITTNYRFSGAVESENTQNITSMREMHVKEVLVKAGDRVKKDDVLIKSSDGEEIKADINGEVSNVYTKSNSHAMQGSQLVDIVDIDHLQLKVKVDEYDLKYLKVGQKVDVTINALDKNVKGTVSSISQEATNENGVSYFTSMISLPKDETIRVGMSAEAKIVKQNVKDVTILPMKAIQFDAYNKPFVFLPSEKGKPIKEYVETGINDGITIEIKDGVKQGENVLIPLTDKEQTDAANMHMGGQS